jgi:hypothetical protein
MQNVVDTHSKMVVVVVVVVVAWVVSGEGVNL